MQGTAGHDRNVLGVRERGRKHNADCRFTRRSAFMSAGTREVTDARVINKSMARVHSTLPAAQDRMEQVNDQRKQPDSSLSLYCR